MSSSAIRHVVIVGGGTAGWLTAGIIAADHRAKYHDGLQVTVIESPNIPILGVGEGTWPSLRDTLRRIGVSETDFLRRCNASFKQGSRFVGWVDGGARDIYFHPFEAPPSEDKVDILTLWRVAPKGTPFAEAASHQAALCLQGRAPKQIFTPEFAAVANYAYHLDASEFAAMLREHCIGKLGVRLIPDDVISVGRYHDGGIELLATRESGNIAGDFFVDCTGTRSLLIGDAPGAGLKDVSDVLFNDRALAVQAPHPDRREPLPSQTNATARHAGWVWDIALQTRRGIGYVYSSAHVSEDQAREDLSLYLKATAPDSGVTGADARLISFRSAYRPKPWIRNIVSVGMAQGFVEPLEASAIVMIELSAAMISDTLPANSDAMAHAGDRFNKRFAYRWDRIVDFLKLHYVLSRRPEKFWADHRDTNSWPERLRHLIGQWKCEPPSREDFTDAMEIFPAASYAYILYGMGFETAQRSVYGWKHTQDTALLHGQQRNAKVNKMLAGLPSNRDLLDHIATRGLTAV